MNNTGIVPGLAVTMTLESVQKVPYNCSGDTYRPCCASVRGLRKAQMIFQRLGLFFYSQHTSPLKCEHAFHNTASCNDPVINWFVSHHTCC